MGLMQFVQVLIVVLAPLVRSQELKLGSYKHATNICNKLIKDPYFDSKMLVGKPWRIYYTWNMKMENKCLDMIFKNATARTVNRVYNDMYEYLEAQPYWDAATLYVKMGRARYEMLLFADQGAAGRFIGVANVIRNGNISPKMKSIPLLKFHMKLLSHGRYLLMSDCQIGVTTLSARRKPVPIQAELLSVVSKLNYGEGFEACIKERNSPGQTVGQSVAQHPNFKFQNVSVENYTSCEEFVANYTFDYKSVVDIDWKIFYFWNYNFEESYNIKFSLASQVLVDRFRFELDEEMKPPVNWSNALLFMETSIEMSALFVTTNVSGIFRIVPSLAFEYNQPPHLVFALKVVEPGYLGILNCKYRLCYALAPVHKMPHVDTLDQEAQKLGFWSDFGRSHRARAPEPTFPPEDFMMDDDDEDEHLELLHNEHIKFL